MRRKRKRGGASRKHCYESRSADVSAYSAESWSETRHQRKQSSTSKLRGLRTPLRPLRELAVLLLGARLSRAPFFLKSRSFQTPGRGDEAGRLCTCKVIDLPKKLETSPPQTPNRAASRPGRVSESDLARLRLLLWSFRGGLLPLWGLGPFGHGFGWCMGMAGIGHMTR